MSDQQKSENNSQEEIKEPINEQKEEIKEFSDGQLQFQSCSEEMDSINTSGTTFNELKEDPNCNEIEYNYQSYMPFASFEKDELEIIANSQSNNQI